MELLQDLYNSRDMKRGEWLLTLSLAVVFTGRDDHDVTRDIEGAGSKEARISKNLPVCLIPALSRTLAFDRHTA